MSKPEAVRYDSGDLETESDGKSYRPHEGEWAEVYPGFLVGEVDLFLHLRELGEKLEALKGQPEALQRQMALSSDAYRRAIAVLADRIAGWSWTDNRGRALPQPGDDPEVFRRLAIDEIWYLVRLVQTGEGPGQRKNA